MLRLTHLLLVLTTLTVVPGKLALAQNGPSQTGYTCSQPDDTTLAPSGPTCPGQSSSGSTDPGNTTGASYLATRVIGEGNCCVNSWQTDIQNHVVDQYAQLTLVQRALVWDFEYIVLDRISGPVQISVNGTVDSTPVVNFSGSSLSHVEVQISTQNLRFPQLPAWGSTPTPVSNFVKVDVSQLTCHFTSGLSELCNQVGFASGPLELGNITFHAMAPILMVHGIWSNYGAFNDYHFAQAFTDLDLPIALLAFRDSNDIGATAKALSLQIRQAAQQFGVHHVHFICHSKGGLWIREFLYHYLNDPTLQSQYPLGVFSVQTLDTPHHGTVAADIAVASRKIAQDLGPFAALPPRPAKPRYLGVSGRFVVGGYRYS